MNKIKLDNLKKLKADRELYWKTYTESLADRDFAVLASDNAWDAYITAGDAVIDAEMKEIKRE